MPARLEITPQLSIDEDELETSFVRASGPGGQNVNKVATAVQLRFDVRRSNSLPQEVKQRLLRLGGKRVSADGILLIEARRFRTQEQNRLDAVERFRQLVRRAAEPPKPRKATLPTQASRKRRLETKRRRGETKRARQSRDLESL
jgi:ribosome-associated protein